MAIFAVCWRVSVIVGNLRRVIKLPCQFKESDTSFGNVLHSGEIENAGPVFSEEAVCTDNIHRFRDSSFLKVGKPEYGGEDGAVRRVGIDIWAFDFMERRKGVDSGRLPFVCRAGIPVVVAAAGGHYQHCYYPCNHTHGAK